MTRFQAFLAGIVLGAAAIFAGVHLTAQPVPDVLCEDYGDWWKCPEVNP